MQCTKSTISTKRETLFTREIGIMDWKEHDSREIFSKYRVIVCEMGQWMPGGFNAAKLPC